MDFHSYIAFVCRHEVIEVEKLPFSFSVYYSHPQIKGKANNLYIGTDTTYI